MGLVDEFLGGLHGLQSLDPRDEDVLDVDFAAREELEDGGFLRGALRVLQALDEGLVRTHDDLGVVAHKTFLLHDFELLVEHPVQLLVDFSQDLRGELLLLEAETQHPRRLGAGLVVVGEGRLDVALLGIGVIVDPCLCEVVLDVSLWEVEGDQLAKQTSDALLVSLGL
jgi:hypothetical protein